MVLQSKFKPGDVVYVVENSKVTTLIIEDVRCGCASTIRFPEGEKLEIPTCTNLIKTVGYNAIQLQGNLLSPPVSLTSRAVDEGMLFASKKEALTTVLRTIANEHGASIKYPFNMWLFEPEDLPININDPQDTPPKKTLPEHACRNIVADCV